MVEAQAIHPALGRVTRHGLEHADQHHADDARTTGRAEDGDPVRAFDEGRGHAREHALAGRDGIGLGANQAIDIGHAGLDGEVVHLIVEQHPGTRRHEPRTEGIVDRQGGGYAVALAVDDGEVGGIRPRAARLGHGPALSRVIGVEVLQALARVSRIEQALERHLDEVRIAQIAGAVLVGAAHGLDHAMHLLGCGLLGSLQGLEHVQHLDQHHPARGGRRGTDHPVTLEVADHRFALDHAVFGQVFERPDAAGGLHGLHQAACGLPGIETVAPITRQPLQGIGQRGLDDAMTERRHLAVLQEEARGRGRGAQRLQAPPGHAPVVFVHHETAARQVNGRRQGERQRQAPVTPGDVHQGCRLAGNAGGKRTVDAGSGHRFAVRVQVHVTGSAQRRTLAPVDHHFEAIVCAMQQPEAAAAQPRAVGLDHGQHGTDRHRRVEGVAAQLEHGNARRRGLGMSAGHGLPRGALTGRRAPQAQQAENKKAPRGGHSADEIAHSVQPAAAVIRSYLAISSSCDSW